MKINKKAEGSASSFMISLLIGLILIVGISTMVTKLSSSFGIAPVDELTGYQGIYDNVSTVGSDFTGSIDSDNSSAAGKDTAEDLTFGKALKAVTKLPKLTKYAGIAITKTLNQIGIPTEFIVALVLIISITLIALLIQIIRGYKNV